MDNYRQRTTDAPPPKMKKRPSLGITLRKMGFDNSYYNRSSGYWKVACSQCQALVLNGIPSHEKGCPNIVREEE